MSRIRRYSGRVPAFETALPAVGHLSLHQADLPADAPAAPTASALDSTALDSRALPTSPAPSADHQVHTLPRLQTSDYDIRGPAAPVAPALYSVGLVMSPAPSAGDSRSYAYAADYSHRAGLDSTPTSPTASPEALNKARFTRDNVLYAFSFLCLHTIHRNMKDIEDAWYAGFKEFFILMMVVCFGMIGVGVMANTSTPMSETNNMISAMMSRTSWILSSCLLLITLSFFVGGHGFISCIVAAFFIMIVMAFAWKFRDPTTTTVVSTLFTSCLSKIKAGWWYRSQPILPL